MSHFGNTCQCEWPYDLNGEKKKREFKTYTLTISIDYSCTFNILFKDYYWTLLKNDRAKKNVFQNGKILLTSASQN